MQRTSQLWQLPGIAYRSTFRIRQFHSRRATAHQSNQSRSWKTLPFVRLGFALVGAGALGYDGYVNDFTYSGSSVRFVRSVKTAVLIAIDYLGLDENDAEYKTKIKVLHQKSADRLLETCLLNGGLYIKVGQGFAAINHILPIEYTSTLAKLQDQCLPTSKEDIQKVFRTDFGQLPEELYEEFDYKPIAAASLAQVFKARLHSGEQVAVKVQYSDLQKRFISDVATIIFLQDIIELVFKNYNFGWIMNDLRKNLVQELNFVQEGHNAERCANDLKKLSYVAVPKIYWPQTKTRVLTMEWMDGYKIGDVDAIKQQNLSLIDVDSKLYNVFAEQIFHTGFVHADPHPGNIFVRKNAHNGHAEIVLLDHGLYEELPENVRGPLCEFWEATVLRDEAKMKVAANKIDVVEYIKFAEVLFQQPIRMRSGPIRSKLSQEELDHIRKVARENFDVIMSTLKEMPRSMLFVIRNLNTVRSIGDKHGNVVNRPQVMARYAQRCLYQRNQRSPVQYIRWMCRRIYFEYCLWSASMRLRVMNYYFNFLYLVGRAPESAKTLVRDLMEQDKQQLH